MSIFTIMRNFTSTTTTSTLQPQTKRPNYDLVNAFIFILGALIVHIGIIIIIQAYKTCKSDEMFC